MPTNGDVWKGRYNGNSRGHQWMLLGGEIDFLAQVSILHHGPICSVCGYSFCVDCQTEPAVDCKGVIQGGKE